MGRSRLKVPVLKERWVVMPVKGRLTPGVSMASREVLPSGSHREPAPPQTPLQLHMEICAQSGEFHFNESAGTFEAVQRKVEEG